MPILKRMEVSEGLIAGLQNNVVVVIRALESAGVIFAGENGEGPGVRLRKATAVFLAGKGQNAG